VAANRRSLAITKNYGQRLREIERRLVLEGQRNWRMDNDFDDEYAVWLEAVIPAVVAAQGLMVRLTSAYLGAFESSERGRVVPPPRIETERFVGVDRNGIPLRESWTSPPIKAKIAIAQGKTIPEASVIAYETSANLIRLDSYASARNAMADHMRNSEVIVGYRRVEGDEPTCGGCLAAIDNEVLSPTEDFATHPGCDCTAEPVYGDVDDLFTHPTGQEIYSRMTAQEKIEAVGLEASQLLDSDTIKLSELLEIPASQAQNTFLQQAPVKDLI
jgi:hypothetical protein